MASPLLLKESHDLAVPRRYDVAGALTSTAALLLIVYAVTEAPTNGWTGSKTMGMFGAAALGLRRLVRGRNNRALLAPAE